MPVTKVEDDTFHDPLELCREALREQWAAKRVEKPRIELRRNIQAPNVQEEDYVLLYYPSGYEYTRRGIRHRTERVPVTLDVRSYKASIAHAIKDEVVRIVERMALKPDSKSEWDEWVLESVDVPADYATYAHFVVETALVKHLRLRPLTKQQGG